MPSRFIESMRIQLRFPKFLDSSLAANVKISLVVIGECSFGSTFKILQTWKNEKLQIGARGFYGGNVLGSVCKH